MVSIKDKITSGVEKEVALVVGHGGWCFKAEKIEIGIGDGGRHGGIKIQPRVDAKVPLVMGLGLAKADVHVPRGGGVGADGAMLDELNVVTSRGGEVLAVSGACADGDAVHEPFEAGAGACARAREMHRPANVDGACRGGKLRVLRAGDGDGGRMAVVAAWVGVAGVQGDGVGARRCEGDGRAGGAGECDAVALPLIEGGTCGGIGEGDRGADLDVGGGGGETCGDGVGAGGEAAEAAEKAGASGVKGGQHAVFLPSGEGDLASLLAVVHIVFEHVGLVTKAAEVGGAEGVVGAEVVVVRVAGINAASTRNCGCGIVWWGIADLVAVGEAVVVGAAALEGVVKSEVVSDLMDHDFAVVGRGTHVEGFTHDAVHVGAVGAGEVGITCDAGAIGIGGDGVDEPDVEVIEGIPADEVLDVEVLGLLDHVGQGRLHAVDAGGTLAARVLGCEAELDLCVDAGGGVVHALVGKGCIEVSDALLDGGVGDVFGAAVVDDVYDDGDGEDASSGAGGGAEGYTVLDAAVCLFLAVKGGGVLCLVEEPHGVGATMVLGIRCLG